MRPIATLAEIWSVLRSQGVRVIWDRVVWHSGHFPKNSMIAWMAALGRLPTRCRLISFGWNIDGTCLLCSRELETRDHLFFVCPYSKCVWEWVLRACNFSKPAMELDRELSWVCANVRGKSFLSYLFRLAWNGCIALLWKERNRRFFTGACRPKAEVVSCLKEVARLKVDRFQGIRRLQPEWGLQERIFIWFCFDYLA
ncbi:hypothetical protein F3Y22_tig00110940pilonHSYRG00524 [Hibiscus syriacus]|uniref:Reverse transcriptase zinc-binding domain-containing protein n=1 Tax=Hibiscus syriacus TaxID=106335 RepID=A0A6A2ZBN8_HIBSY|nr:hypothetical protein F3Y22_tig00110940pilonHSYRG00524 [Hibiscus syriacus]